MRTIAIAIACIAGAAIAFGFTYNRVRNLPRELALIELLHAKAAVEKSLGHRQTALRGQLDAFAQLVAAERDFSMKLLVEQDRSAPEVTQIAVRYMPAMGLSLLEVADSADNLLSSGHFPASAGNSVTEKLDHLDTAMVFIDDLVNGMEALTLQAGVETTLGDATRITCAGGWLVNERFLEQLMPHQGVRLLLHHGESYLGMPGVGSVSPVADNRMIVNDTAYLATTLPLPYRGDGAAPELVILMDMPGPLSLF